MIASGRRATALKVLTLVTAVAFALPAPVAAHDPQKSGQPAKGGPAAGGITQTANGATPEELGYTSEYAAQKQADANRLVPIGKPGTKTPNVSAFGVQDAVSGSLTGWRQYHQYTNYWCLSAMVQSILQFKYGAWAGPDVATSKAIQKRIYDQIGTYEDNAVAFLNNQFGLEGDWFRYVMVATPDVPTFIQHMKYDIGFAKFPMYARAQVANKNYVWYQDNPGYHASAAVGFRSSGALVDISDPFFSPTSRAGCVTGHATWGYDPNQLYGCVYAGYSTSKYWLAEAGEWW